MGHRDIFQYSHPGEYSIRRDRRFYLDTGVLRRRASTLTRSPLRHVAYTSSLALIELLVGAVKSDREFRARRAAVAAVFEADVAVDWQMCDVKVYCAFPRLRPAFDIYESRSESLQKITRLFVQSRDRSRFAAALRSLVTPEPFSYFEKFDRHLSEKHLRTGHYWHKKLKELWMTKPEDETSAEMLAMVGLPANASYAQFRAAFKGTSFENGTTVYSLVQRVARDQGITSAAIREELFRTYDGSVDQYLQGLSRWDYEEASGQEAGRNDPADVCHLLHLVDGACLVTTDRKFARRADEIGIEVCGPDSPLAGA